MKKQLKLVDGAPNEIVFEREFDAPRDLVYRAMTEPGLIERWMGNSRSPIVEVEVDLRVGGTYKHRFRMPDGTEFAFTGRFLELSPERFVHTERFNDMPTEALVTTTLTERDGKTLMRMVQAFDSAQTRDMVIATGMADGAGESYVNLDALLSAL
jgi:uncharacterized protein YndB with AHSA1/START domain